MSRSGLTLLLALAPAAAPAVAQTPPNLLSREAGARVVSFSSDYGGSWSVQNLVAGRTAEDEGELPVWCSGSAEPFPHWAVIELPRPTWLTTLVFNNALPDEPSYPGISARDIQVLVSDRGPDAGFRPVAGFRLQRNRNGQEVRIEPVEARWIKINITSNWGHTDWTELGQLGAFDDGTRTADLGSALQAGNAVDLYGIYFDFGAATLREESAPVLDQITALLRARGTMRLAVEGHTDDVGSGAANQRLSEQRAAAVVSALAGRGVGAERLRAVGYGATRPVADNGTVVGRAKNRRVTLRVE